MRGRGDSSVGVVGTATTLTPAACVCASSCQEQSVAGTESCCESAGRRDIASEVRAVVMAQLEHGLA